MFGLSKLHQERERAQGRLVHTPAGAIYVEETGSLEGEPFILVHGLAASTMIWEPLSSFLVSQGYRVITFDLFGRGLSDRPRQSHRPPLFRNQLRAVVRAFGIKEPFTLMGLSMGGLIAADYSAQYPEQIKQLLLIAPAGVPTARPFWADWGTKRGVGELVMVLLGRRILPGILGRGFASAEAASRWVPKMIEMSYLPGYRRTLLSSMRHMPLSSAMTIFEEVGAHRYPVGILWGDRDIICPYENRKAVLQAIPRARFVTVVGGGHVAHLDCPSQFEEVLHGLLDFEGSIID